MTFIVSRSSLISSTTPLKLANGPSVIRTCSLFSNLIFEPWLIFCRLAAEENRTDLFFRERHRLVAGTQKRRHLRRVLQDVPKMVVQFHFDQHIAGQEKPAPPCAFSQLTISVTGSVGIITRPTLSFNPKASMRLSIDSRTLRSNRSRRAECTT